jgi:porphobilinogen synthase
MKHNLRLRRMRKTDAMRRMVRETHLIADDFIYPLFIKEGLDEKVAISSMPGIYQLAQKDVIEQAKRVEALGIPAVILFGIPSHKDAAGSASYDENGIIQKTTSLIKEHTSNLLVITDACFCEYTDHGHCGLIKDNDVDNDKTLELLALQALTQAKAGADIIAPSGMIDGMVASIRQCLDDNGFSHIPILSYAAKYASSFYGPFREAAEGAPSFGDRKTYQMDIANGREALREVSLDVKEGADMLMVKPAMAYLDVIQRVKQLHPDIPLCAYQVSGEYAMIKCAAHSGLIDEHDAMCESLIAIKRAGADMIISYFATDYCQMLS